MEVPINNDSTTTHLIMKVVINLQSTIKKKKHFQTIYWGAVAGSQMKNVHKNKP